jgi:RNA polymerase sigma-70 factor (ECF subfamily)
VYRLSFAILGNEADARDAMQETLVTAWRQLRGLRDSERFDAWLQRVVVNAARQVIRSNSRRRIREVPASTVEALASRAAPAGRDDAAILDLALRTLPVEQRSILVLHHLEGHGLGELAEILSIPVGTAKSRLFAARRALATAITREEAR